ncbi:MAG TPA: rhamnogalacturonan acetylesterase [Opitutaceae bacterium]|nr:rhamnogalacturonan acetylesterase [Opitutaceae bacterium]
MTTHPHSTPRLVALFLFAAAALSAAPASTFKFQFGADQAAPGYTLVPPSAVYAKETGYGFEPGAALTAVARANSDPLRAGAVASAKPFAFSVAVPEGNYRVTVTLGDPTQETVATVKSERRRLMLERVQAAAGQFVTRSFLVNVRTPKIPTGGAVDLNDREQDKATGAITTLNWDDKLTIGFSNTHPALAALAIEKVDDAITFFILGDSTVTDQGGGGSWGQMAPRWFGPGVVVANHAESGETLKGFLMHRRWDKVVDSIKRGDYVLIEFGTNDSKNSGPQNMYAGQDFSVTYAEPNTTYRELLRRFASDVRAKGGNPIIVSPSARRGETAAPGSLSPWAEAAMATAKEIGAPAIDLNAMGMQLNAALGADADKQFADRTHHSEYGAYLQAKCIVLGIKQANLPLAKYIVDDFGRFDPQHPEPTLAQFSLPSDMTPGGRGGRGARGGAPGAANGANAANAAAPATKAP